MELSKKEESKLCQVLTHLENQFEDELEALANVFNMDENGIDLEVQLSDGETEQMFISMELLKSDEDAKEIACQIG